MALVLSPNSPATEAYWGGNGSTALRPKAITDHQCAVVNEFIRSVAGVRAPPPGRHENFAPPAGVYLAAALVMATFVLVGAFGVYLVIYKGAVRGGGGEAAVFIRPRRRDVE